MNRLKNMLSRMDGKGYKTYKSLEGEYIFPNFKLVIDHVQSDPFAPPSACRILISHEKAKFPAEFWENDSRKTALEDYITRRFYEEARRKSGRSGSGKSGMITIMKPGQKILRRSSMVIDGRGIEARFYVGLPGHGRRIAAREAKKIFFEALPQIVEEAMIYHSSLYKKIREHVEVAEDANFIRGNLKKEGLVAFVANDSILPRKSGIEDEPMENAIKFVSPPSLETSFECPNRKIEGMGIKEGLTLIVGGAYHGKSTLLEAISMGIYNHIPGDGREFVIAREDAVKIRAEDGRYVANVDISSFISNLPNNVDTSNFSTENASGSTSQAANICEAMEIGAKFLLIDEDTSATNLMLRDRRMQELIPKEKEPITPLIDMLPSLKRKGISIIMIAGGIGEYFDEADLVLMMDRYIPKDVTDRAKKIALEFKSKRIREEPKEIRIKERKPLPETINPSIRGKIKIKAESREKLRFGMQTIDLGRVEQIVERGQVKAIGDVIYRIAGEFAEKSLRQVMDKYDGKFLTLLPPRGEYVEPRKYEVAFALNRLRGMKCR